MWRAPLIAEAKTWEGTPYSPKGRVKGVGVDCGGLLYEVYNPVFGPFASFPEDYAADWALHTTQERYLDFIMPHVKQVPAVLPGGFSVYHMGNVYAHAAIMLDNGNYLHAWGRRRQGRVTQSPVRTMNYFAKQFGNGFVIKHFDPIEK